MIIRKTDIVSGSICLFFIEKSSARMILFVLHRVNFTIFLVGVMWYGMYKGGERYASFIYVFGIIVRMQTGNC